VAEPVPALHAAAAEWSPARRLGFRFVFSYLLVYNLQLVLSWIPGTGWLAARYLGAWRAIAPWVGRHLLHLGRDISSVPNGSGDRTFDYLQILCMLASAAIAALAWTALDRRRREVRLLHEGLRIYLRYALGLILLSYGMGTLLKVQFPFPSIERLQESIGDSSPMALLWTFMGYSTPYDVFAGALEALGGFLLFFRRTTTFGALLVLGAMGNVAMLAFSYDVPQKLFSLHVVLMAVFLLAPDLRRLVDGLVLDRPTRPADITPPFTGRWTRTGRVVLKTLVVGYALVATATRQLDLRRELTRAPRPPLYGVYDVEELIRDGRTVPLWIFDPNRWQRLIVPVSGELAVNLMDGSRRAFATVYGPRSVTLLSDGPAGKKVTRGTLAWSRPDSDHLVLQGAFDGSSLAITFRKLDESKYLLVSRGFRLIIDDPINR
jgi:hypothetical protein